MIRSPALLAALLCALALSASAAAEDWPRFRGPNGEGVSPCDTIPVRWASEDYRWRIELPGIGYSSPVVIGDRLFVSSALEEDATQILRCLKAADGSTLWEKRFESITHPKHKYNCYASSTPTVDGQRVYFAWATPKNYRVVALAQADGKELWRRDLGAFAAEHGFGASPVLVEGLLVLPNDQNGKSEAVALDPASGRPRWRLPRNNKVAAYSTPFVFQPASGPAELIFTSSSHGITSVDPKSGKVNWEARLLKDRVVGSGTVAGGLILAGCGVGGVGTRMVAVRPPKPGSEEQPQLVYEIPKGAIPYVPVPVAAGDLLFLWFDRGIVSCLDAKSGSVHWKERIGGDYFASPVRLGERIYCVSREGEMVVLAAAQQYKLLARFSLGERSNSTPAVADGVMYLRTASHLMALDGKRKP